MQITLTAAGAPAEIQSSINRDAARERTADADAGGVVQAIRDYVAKKTGAANVLEGDETPSTYVVSVDVKITIEEHANTEDAERARRALVGGQPVASKTAPALAKIDELDRSRRASDAAQKAAEDRIDAANIGKTK